AVARRGAALMERLAGESGHTIALTHAVPIRAVIVHVLGAPLSSVWKIDIEPLSLTEFRSDGRRWVLHASGVVAG
ncbi:histidine phosphatase family protein, partial [Mesorhizobium sp. M1C.F.Ca.ET.193.01.1.1]